MTKAHRLLVMHGFDIHTEIIELLTDKIIVKSDNNIYEISLNEVRLIKKLEENTEDTSNIPIIEDELKTNMEEPLLLFEPKENEESIIEDIVEIEDKIVTIKQEIQIDPKDVKKPRGWHFKPVFVDSEGNVYHKGKLQPELKDTLPNS
jgi:hypothetical protein